MAFSGRELIVVRHGEAEGNARNIAQGRQPYPLTARGREQAAAVAKLMSELGWAPTHVVASPVLRAVETATIIVAALGAPAFVQDEAFTEIDCGLATGRDFGELEQEYPELFARPVEEWLGFGFVGGEDDQQLYDRVAEGIDRLPAGERILLVTHGAVFKGVLKHLVAVGSNLYLDLRCGSVLRFATQTVLGTAVLALTHYLHADEWAQRVN